MVRCRFLLLLAVACTGCSGYGTKMTFNGGELYRTSSVTKDEAERLGQFLVKDGFFDGTPKTVQLNKKAGEYELRLVIKPEYQKNADYGALLEMFGAEVRDEVFPGETVVVHLCDERLKTVRTLTPLSSHVVNKGTICYSSGVTKEELDKLGQTLVTEQVFDGTPKTVRLDAVEDGYQLTMVMSPNVFSNPAMLESFKQKPGEWSQQAFGGKPLTLVLRDQSTMQKKFFSSK
jgi:RNase H-fold protein (predicted Holliday junction resolvase)